MQLQPIVQQQYALAQQQQALLADVLAGLQCADDQSIELRRLQQSARALQSELTAARAAQSAVEQAAQRDGQQAAKYVAQLQNKYVALQACIRDTQRRSAPDWSECHLRSPQP